MEKEIPKKKPKDEPIIPPEDADLERPPRRDFLTDMWVVLGLAVLAELLWLVFRFLSPRKQAAGKG